MNTLTHDTPHPLPRLGLGSPGLRLRTWLTRRTLDHRLAEGESILTDPALARRANQLTSLRCRHSLASGLHRVVADAERPSRSLTSAVPVQRKAVLHARAGLERLASRLESDDPVGLEGVAQVQILLTDGGSPLYDAAPEGELDFRVESAEQSLETD
jgi:hypothetical protein